MPWTLATFKPNLQLGFFFAGVARKLADGERKKKDAWYIYFASRLVLPI